MSEQQGQVAGSRTLVIFYFVYLHDKHAAAGLPANTDCVVKLFSRARRQAGAGGASESNLQLERSP